MGQDVTIGSKARTRGHFRGLFGGKFTQARSALQHRGSAVGWVLDLSRSVPKSGNISVATMRPICAI
jgi:hypothetical protein